jgi:hypothetical protein
MKPANTGINAGVTDDVNPFLLNAKAGVAVDALVVLNNEAARSAAGH